VTTPEEEGVVKVVKKKSLAKEAESEERGKEIRGPTNERLINIQIFAKGGGKRVSPMKTGTQRGEKKGKTPRTSTGY